MFIGNEGGTSKRELLLSFLFVFLFLEDV
jgi:hypothetical protein